MTTPTDLLAALEAATDRLDDETLARFICVVKGVPYGSHSTNCGDDGSDEFSVFRKRGDTVFCDYLSRAPDRDLSAAHALIRERFPEAYVEWQSSQTQSRCLINRPVYATAIASNLPLAGCKALLRAVMAEAG